jgi:hypothetical protein
MMACFPSLKCQKNTNPLTLFAFKLLGEKRGQVQRKISNKFSLTPQQLLVFSPQCDFDKHPVMGFVSLHTCADFFQDLFMCARSQHMSNEGNINQIFFVRIAKLPQTM